jgi:hypothetical protein
VLLEEFAGDGKLAVSVATKFLLLLQIIGLLLFVGDTDTAKK